MTSVTPSALQYHFAFSPHCSANIFLSKRFLLGSGGQVQLGIANACLHVSPQAQFLDNRIFYREQIQQRTRLSFSVEVLEDVYLTKSRRRL